tara:strand:+ start:5 stop:1228 length:1224 start_codon:yes stop_codon:yes gene_type:complete
MNYILRFFVSFLILICSLSYAQSDKVFAGPMLSHVDAYGSQIWFLLDSSAKKIKIDVRDYENDQLIEYSFNVLNKDKRSKIPYTISIETLEPNTEYRASVFVDNEFIKELDIFTKRPHLDDIQFLLGSNLGNPSEKIFHHMTKTNSDFMVWLGGHVSFSSPITFEEIILKYIDVRSNDALNNFMSSTPQISTWGQADYGLDIGVLFELKDNSHQAFDLFWPNSSQKTYNYTYFDYGTYQRYTYNDLDLFLLDAMSFMTEDKSVLYSTKQLDRMFQEIKNNGATFTIIASPLPFTFDTEESYLQYKKEFDYFLERLDVAGVNGVVLLSTGNTSGTIMNEYKLPKKLGESKYVKKSLYEFHFSPLHMNTYSMVSISGKKGYRVFSFETYNENGNLIYRKSLYERELKIN